MPLPLADSANVSHVVLVVHGGFCTSLGLAWDFFFKIRISGICIFHYTAYTIYRLTLVLWIRIAPTASGLNNRYEFSGSPGLAFVSIGGANTYCMSEQKSGWHNLVHITFCYSAPLSVSKNIRQRSTYIEINLCSAANCPDLCISLWGRMYVKDCFYLSGLASVPLKIRTCE